MAGSFIRFVLLFFTEKTGGPTEEENVQELYLKAVRVKVIGGF